MHFQHAFSSVYASFHVQSCAMCRSNMQISYSDTPDIVINFRKSKGHVISDINCILPWTQDELKSADRRTRKLMTMHRALDPRADVAGMYISRKSQEDHREPDHRDTTPGLGN